jgi:hypothetical protein
MRRTVATGGAARSGGEVFQTPLENYVQRV